MLNLAEYRKKPQGLADFLPWAALVATGVVANKDGSFQRTARFRGPDLDSATPAELVSTTARLNGALRRLGSNRIVMPNGRSIVLERQPGTDPEGYGGLEDQVDNHWGALFKAALLSTILSVGSEAGTSSNSETSLVDAIRRGSSDSFSQTGRQVVGRSLQVQPTITVRPGLPVRVIVTRDLVMEPYAG